MEKLKKLRKALSEINVNEIYENAVKQTHIQDSIISLNHEQLQEGLYTTGEKIKTYNSSSGVNGFYSSVTESFKRDKGQPIDKVTLYDSGEFYNSERLQANKGNLKFSADFQKDDGNIADNLDITNVLGLSEENIEVVGKKIILPIIESTINGKLQNI